MGGWEVEFMGAAPFTTTVAAPLFPFSFMEFPPLVFFKAWGLRVFSFFASFERSKDFVLPASLNVSIVFL